MVRRILVPLDPSAYSQAAQQYAFEIAREHDAVVTGLGILDTPAIRQSTQRTSPGAMAYAKKAEDLHESEAHRTLQELFEAFDRRAESSQVRHNVREMQGDPEDVIVGEARFYDLLVVGLRTQYHFETSNELDRSVREMLGRLATPILLVPDSFVSFHEQDVLIAFDGSFSATRSLRQFATLAIFADPSITILTSAEEQVDAEAEQQRAAEYLAAYDFTRIQTAWTPQDIGAAIRESYLDEADLIVLGTHAKKSWFDFKGIGSLAASLMDDSPVPILIGQ